ncbi:MAG: rod shape-determining protein MreC [Lachnospiraceae bacterium]|nr:rod shape-determining protein MreC [Lachnospiraceae bacterium]
MGRRVYGRSRISIPSKYVFLILSILCVAMMLLSFTTDFVTGPVNAVAGYVIVPFQKGIAAAGSWLEGRSENIRRINELNEENKVLKERIDEMTIRINDLERDKYELAELRSLFLLDEQYSDYNKIGARVIGKDIGNWYSEFTIDKGSNDGIEKDMNVMAGSGLVGIVTKVGPNWSGVRSIIDDTSNLSGMVMSTSDTLIVSGDLELMDKGYIKFSQLIDEEDEVVKGDQVVTSSISDKYLPGISVGYITEIETDSNNLTKSGYITPVVDFKNLSTVLVVTDLKETFE